MSDPGPPSGPLSSAYWRERIRIHSYDVDSSRRATVPAICRSFLEAAWNHAEQLGVGYFALAQQNCFWVLARLLVQFDAYPGWGDEVELVTWPRGGSGALAYRDFEVRTAGAQRLIAGSSSWLVLDASSRRPQRITRLLEGIADQPPQMALGREAAKLPVLEMAGTGFSRTVHHSDIDVNGHVNSVRYIEWLLDSYDSDFHRNHALHTMEINYSGETHCGDTIGLSSHRLGPDIVAHAIVKAAEREVCRAELTWSERPAE